MPIFVATWAAAFGMVDGMVHVATITPPMSAGVRPASSIALVPAMTDMSTTPSSLAATRRLTMPTRSRIHSSEVSMRAARSWLLTTVSGW